MFTTYDELITTVLITRGRIITEDVYKEQHHIVPRCCGGSNSSDNLIDLLPEEHYHAHRLLADENPDSRELQQAWACMTFMKGTTYKVTAEEFAEARARQAKLSSLRFKGKPTGRKGIPCSKETKEKIRPKCKLYKPTIEARTKQSEAQRGRVVSQETREKISRAQQGKQRWSDEEKLLISERMKGNQNAKGHVLSEESKNKIWQTRIRNGTNCWSAEQRARYMEAEHHWNLSEDTKKRMSDASKGIPKSERHRNSLSEAQVARFGSKQLTPELKQEILTAMRQGLDASKCERQFGISRYRILKHVKPLLEEAQDATE